MPPASLDWEQHRETMRALYVDENKTLKDVMDIMRGSPYHFSATKKQYERQFQKKWRFRKNLTKQDWRILHFKVSKRQSKGKRTKVFVDGRPQQMEKLEHEVSRYGLAKSVTFESEPKTPDGICLRSPTPSSSIIPTSTISQSGPDSGNTDCFHIPAAAVGLIESDLIQILSQMDELPYFELYKRFDSGFRGLASFISLPDKPEENGKEPNHEVDASKRAYLWKAMMPRGTDSTATSGYLDDTKDPLVQFLTNAAYILYNGLGTPELGAVVVRFLSAPQNRQVMEDFMSSPSITVEALAEELFISLLQQGNDQAALGLLQQGRVAPHPLQLVEASRTGCLRTVQLLLERGVDPNSRPVSREPLYKNPNPTALEHAISSGNTSVAKKLVDYGADPNNFRKCGEPRECAFIDAIRRRNSELLEYFLQSNACQKFNDSVKPDHHTLRLSVAAECGHDEMVKTLLPYVDISHYTPDGYSALVAAAIKGNKNIVSFLLESGASPKRSGIAAKRNSGPSPLQAAVYGTGCQDDRDDLDIIRLLIEHGADPNEPPEDRDADWFFKWSTTGLPSRTALQAAADIRHEKLFFYLLDHGADAHAHAAKRHGFTALQAAIRSGSEALWSFFSSTHGCIESPPPTHAGTTALIEAIRIKNIPAVRQFLESGCDVNYTGSTQNGCTALSAAILIEDMALVKLLLDFGADVNHPQPRRDGGTALQAAIRIGNTSLMEELITLGADVFDDKALLMAVALSPMNVCNTILSAIETEMNRHPEKEIEGQLALQAAIQTKHESIVLRLVQLGIDLNEPAIHEDEASECNECSIRREPGLNPWIMFQCFGNGPQPDDVALATAVRLGRKEIVELLLQNGASVESAMKIGNRSQGEPLAGAAAMGLHNIVETLLIHGADINTAARGWFGRTALQAATENGHFAVVHLLLDRGADCNAPPSGYGGATALQLASIKGYVGIAGVLLNHGADPNAEAANVYGRTALEGAAEHGRLDMLQLLLNSGALIGSPKSASSKRVFAFAYKGGHMAAMVLLKTHQVKKWGSAHLDGNSPQETSFTVQDWRICQECSWGYEEAYGHCCEDYTPYDEDEDFENGDDEDEDEEAYEELSEQDEEEAFWQSYEKDYR